ncbi:12S seed storage protein CRD-like [Bidens hawaiensis]|uniref:12S seed storage protein CRD-like n=1 Tax=Bidens hawaiensis TaxID=980011 RepID=UPI00404A1756
MDAKLVVEKYDQTLFEGDSGGYYVWSNAKVPLLSDLKLGTGRLVLHPLGFTLPHYADCSKIGFVLEGTVTIGLISANSSEEKVLIAKKGDAVPTLAGLASWWFNAGDIDAVIIYLGESSKAIVPGQFTYFLPSGPLGYLAGFQSDFVSKIFGLDETESENLIYSQQGLMVTLLDQGIKFPEPSNDTKGVSYATIDDQSDAVVVNCGGFVNDLTEKNLPVLSELGLSARFVKLEGNAMLTPSYVADGSVHICYVCKGSGQIKIVGGFQGTPALDSKVEEGDLFIVPQYYELAYIADDSGLEVFSVITSSKALFGQLAGNTSIWKAMSSGVVQATLNVTQEFAQQFKSINETNLIIVPPST